MISNFLPRFYINTSGDDTIKTTVKRSVIHTVILHQYTLEGFALGAIFNGLAGAIMGSYLLTGVIMAASTNSFLAGGTLVGASMGALIGIITGGFTGGLIGSLYSKVSETLTI